MLAGSVLSSPMIWVQSQDPHGRTRDSTPVGCPVTFTGALWHTCAHTNKYTQADTSLHNRKRGSGYNICGWAGARKPVWDIQDLIEGLQIKTCGWCQKGNGHDLKRSPSLRLECALLHLKALLEQFWCLLQKMNIYGSRIWETERIDKNYTNIWVRGA